MPPAPPAAPAPRVDVTESEPSDIWSREQRSDHVVAGIAVLAEEVDRMVQSARHERDVVRLVCTNDKLTQLSGIEQAARDRRTALRSALLEDDDGAADWNALAGLAERARATRAEANQCIGEELGFASEVTTIQADSFGAPAHRDEMSKEQLVRTRMRTSLVRDSVLGAPAPPPPPPSDVPVGKATPSPMPSAPPSAERDAPHDASMLIRTADLTLAVYEVDKTLGRVEAIAKQQGGYLALRADRRVTVRVPRERFDAVLAQIEKLGDVLHRNVSAEDVTDQYVDLEMRLKNALSVRARMEKLLESAGVHDAVEIHKELAKVTEEIERLQGKLKLLRDRVGYSTITVALEPTQPQAIRTRALLPFPWMTVMGLGPLLAVPR